MDATPPNPPRKIPTLRHHKATGQGYVVLNRRCLYLGAYGQPRTEQRYHQTIAEWLAAGRQLPAPAAAVTIAELAARYWLHAQRYYTDPHGRPSTEQRHFHRLLGLLRGLYGSRRAADFGPRALLTLREQMTALGWCRRHVNHSIGRVKRIFRWATEQELVPGSVYHALQAVGGLRQGRGGARESEPVRPIPQELIDGVRPYVSRQVWAMIQLQLLTAARPGEITPLRPADLDRSGAIWTYTPAEHKTAHRGHQRTIYLGPRAQQVLRPFLLRPPTAYCFSPAEAETERRRARHEARRTPLSCGNRPGSNRTVKPRRAPGDVYTRAAYHRAIVRACEQAFEPPEDLRRRKVEGPKGLRLETLKQWRERLCRQGQWAQLQAWRREVRWHPHQLRHNAATYLRKEFGLETARVILGHRSAAVTTIYAEADQQKAVEAMLRIG